ncbi:MAG: hypothetical protein WAO98_00915 [Alphaproteobacteria bacterium]
MSETLSPDYALSSTLVDCPLPYNSEYNDKVHLTARLSNAPHTDAINKVYATARVVVGKNSVDIDLDNTPTVALNDSWREKSGLIIPTIHEVQARHLPGISNISGGTVLATDHGNNFITLRRDVGAPSFAGYLIEPCGRCGEVPSVTMNAELDEELFVLRSFHNEWRIVSFVDDQKPLASSALIERQVGILKNKLIDLNLDPEALLTRPVEPVAMRWSEADFRAAKEITVRVGDRILEQFRAIAWFDSENNTLEMRRSMIVEMPRHEMDREKVMIFDGDGFGRAVVMGTRKALSAEPCTPFLKRYLTQNLG